MRHLNLLVLRCASVERARAFYELLGFSFAKHAHGNGPEHYAHEDEQGVMELYPSDTTNPPDKVGLGFFTENLESLHNRFKEGGFLPNPIRDNPWGRTFIVRDPDDRRVEIKKQP